jgi:hypothetical protein
MAYIFNKNKLTISYKTLLQKKIYCKAEKVIKIGIFTDLTSSFIQFYY